MLRRKYFQRRPLTKQPSKVKYYKTQFLAMITFCAFLPYKEGPPVSSVVISYLKQSVTHLYHDICTEKAPLVGFDLDRIREDKLDQGGTVAGGILPSLLQQAVVVEEHLKQG